jgi:hypothetical protein
VKGLGLADVVLCLWVVTLCAGILAEAGVPRAGDVSVALLAVLGVACVVFLLRPVVRRWSRR